MSCLIHDTITALRSCHATTTGKINPNRKKGVDKFSFQKNEIFGYFLFFKYLPEYKREKAKVNNGLEFLKMKIEEHRRDMEDGLVSNNYIHSFLQNQQRNGDFAELALTGDYIWPTF